MSRGSTIDMRPGAYSDVAYFSRADQIDAAVAPAGEWSRSYYTDVYNRPVYEWTQDFAIALATTIENVIGTAKADTIIGNAVANVFTGGAGTDTFQGYGGNDTYRDTAANLNGDTVVDFINADVVTVADAAAPLVGLSYVGSTLSFALAGFATTYTMTLTGASGLVQQRANLAGGVDVYFGTSSPAPVYAIAVSPASEPEGSSGTGNILTYNVTRTGDTSAATVDLGLSGTATGPGVAGADYTVAGLTAGKLTFAMGATSASFTVTTVPDTSVEPNETVIATTSNPSGGGTLGTATATGTIANDDSVAPLPVAEVYTIGVTPTSAAEGTGGTGAVLTYTVTRTDGASAASVDVAITGTAAGPGAADADYAVAGLTAGKLAFGSGATTATFTITTMPDAVYEANETVVVSIVDPVDSEKALASATATITNDDAAPIDAPPSVPADIDGPTGGSIKEGAGAGTLAGITASSAAVNGGTVLFSLADDAGGRFAIDATTGVVSVVNAALVDFESAAGAALQRRAGAGLPHRPPPSGDG